MSQPWPAPSRAVHKGSREPWLDPGSPPRGLQTRQSDHKCVHTRRPLLHRQVPCGVWRPRLVCKHNSPDSPRSQGRPGGPAGRILAKIAPLVWRVGNDCVWWIAAPSLHPSACCKGLVGGQGSALNVRDASCLQPHLHGVNFVPTSLEPGGPGVSSCLKQANVSGDVQTDAAGHCLQVFAHLNDIQEEVQGSALKGDRWNPEDGIGFEDIMVIAGLSNLCVVTAHQSQVLGFESVGVCFSGGQEGLSEERQVEDLGQKEAMV